MKDNKILNKGTFLIGLLAVVALLAIGNVNAVGVADAVAIQLITPGDSGMVSGDTNYTLNISSGWEANITSCTFLAKSSSTSNSTYTIIGTFTNGTSGGTDTCWANLSTSLGVFANMTISHNRGIEDSNDYTVFANCTEGGQEFNATGSSTSIIFDNTEPKVFTKSHQYNYTTDNPFTNNTANFSIRIFANQSISASGCTLYFKGSNPGSTSYSATYNEPLCYYEFDNTLPEGEYVWYMGSSDGSNTTYSAPRTLFVNTPGYAAPPGLVIPKVQDDKGALIVILILVGVVLFPKLLGLK